ncbi:MAG: TonB-dependent receptor [Cytophagaceae bacterium]|nr:TonB-dependent receptor [Cytophagaceae bacterium]
MQRLVLLFGCLAASVAAAQTRFSGKILDAQTQKPISGVTVSVGAQPRTATNTDGTFALTADSVQVTVQLSAIGYQSRQVQLSADTTSNRIFLQPVEYQLNEVIVRAYETNRRLAEVPAAVATLSRRDLDRFAGVSLVPALNTLPGVRMEERSPGSYRLSIRGSTLRSPFGVRNVKVYWNDLPFTDPGGNTYLQQFDWQSIGSVEVIKGPAGSLYGAGTGGVVLLESPRPVLDQTRLNLGTTLGNYGLRSFNAGFETASSTQQTALNYSKLSADGYRVQSALQREVLSLNSRFFLQNNQTISASVLYSDLEYQTPGGLTRAQFLANPRQARPPGGPNPGAVEQQATFRIKTFYVGGSHQWAVTPRWNVRSALYGTFSQVENPAIRNYERRAEQSFGGRFTASYQLGAESSGSKLIVGGEAQRGFFNVKTFGNRRGILDTLQIDEEIIYTPWSLFAQLETNLGRGWQLTGGLSYNGLAIDYTRLYRRFVPRQRRKFTGVLSPRLAVLKKLSDRLTAYASVSQGFSPPTVAEVRPSEGTFNNTLNPERGTNYEAGLRGNLAKNRLSFDLTAYAFRLNETIVIRRAADGAEFFTNAGTTRQNGVEASISYLPFGNRPASGDDAAFRNSKIWLTYAYQPYRFDGYVSGTSDFSGNQLTGTPPHILTAGIDVFTKAGFYSNLTLSYTDAVPTNDANSDFAPGYRLLGGKIGYKISLLKRLDVNAYAGIDNALDEQYTPAPDLNAVGNRFYNPAVGRNWYGGLRVSLNL